MGMEKAGVEWEGSSLLARVLEALSPVCGDLVVVRSAGQELPALPAGVPSSAVRANACQVVSFTFARTSSMARSASR